LKLIDGFRIFLEIERKEYHEPETRTRVDSPGDKAEEKIRIVLEGLRGEASIAEVCRKEGINPNVYYKWSKEFLEAGRKRLQGNTEREATSSDVIDLRKENDQLKALVAELSLKNRVLKKSLNGLEPGLGEEWCDIHRQRRWRSYERLKNLKHIRNNIRILVFVLCIPAEIYLPIATTSTFSIINPGGSDRG